MPSVCSPTGNALFPTKQEISSQSVLRVPCSHVGYGGVHTSSASIVLVCTDVKASDQHEKPATEKHLP